MQSDVLKSGSGRAMRRIHHIHFVGIGGAGMCGIAEVLLNQGYVVSGSDLHLSEVTDRLQKQGVQLFKGHACQQVQGADVVVISSAISQDNPELIEARRLRTPIIRRAEMLAELMRYRHGIAVAGTHGKTTTTSLIASIFAEAGLDPTFIIGGLLNRTASNAQLGSSHYMIAEADESDASFLHLQPMVVVLTNVDRDHLANYEGSFAKLKEAFLAFIHNLPFYGLVVACEDDAMVASMLPSMMRPVMTYGFSDEVDYQVVNWVQTEQYSHFEVVRPGAHPTLAIDFGMPGRHNVLNAVAAVVVATDEGIADEAICQGLKQFSGVGRRFEVHGLCAIAERRFLLIDDYGHHPNEVRATIEAVRKGWPERRLVMVYQPHRYSRTAELFDQFIEVLALVDVLLISEVYAAGEPVIPGAPGADLHRKLKASTLGELHWLSELSMATEVLTHCVEEQDVVLTQGAGETAKLAFDLARLYRCEVVA
jgi:UDP-N-acetylmuramate--alanine ligase